MRATPSASLAVHSLDHFSLSVPDLDQARDFFETFGLDVRGEASGLALHTFGHAHRWARLSGGAGKALRYIAFGVFAEDLAAFGCHLDALGVERAAPPADAEGPSVWLRDPHGVLLGLLVAAKSSPDAKRSPPAHATQRGAPSRSELGPVRPARLSHALFFTPDIDRTVEFYCRVLGLRLSDHPGPVAFLHGMHGSDHHLIAFAQSSAPGFHHSAWEVASIDEVALGAAQMAAAGHTRGWGLGRHVLGSNYFHYVQDPWGSYAEYSFDIDYIPAGLDWHAGHPDPEDSFYLWGPAPPEDFVVNHEAPAPSGQSTDT